MVYGIYPRCYEAEPSNPEGIPYTTASEESMWLVPQLTAFHQSQAEKSLAEHSCKIPLGNTFGFRQLKEQRLEKCGLCNSCSMACSLQPITGLEKCVLIS